MNQDCKLIRQDILTVSHKSGQGHIPTCFSVVELLYGIYNIIRHKPDDPQWQDRDIFILSKGHASLAHYCVLAKYGYFPIDRVTSFGAFMSDFGCHADRLKIPGIEASTGSLGHGIGLAVGMALAFQTKKSDRRVFTIIGDGESNEGSVWEAVMVGVNLQLRNLTIFYDDNQSHARGLQINNAAGKFRAFGCEVSEIDGHDLLAIEDACRKQTDKVHVVIAKTIKGGGCSTTANNQYEWHRKSPTAEELQQLMRELDEETI
ncbi:MAG: transketolase [Magnetococcales bacterium]|nr:transketolase [Magnetococcales bacterium]